MVGFVASSVLACPVGRGSSWEVLSRLTTLVVDELSSVAVGHDDTERSDSPRNVLNLKQTMDAPRSDRRRRN